MKEVREFREIVYGPVDSWRYKKSLGINILGNVKRICTYSCIYCELGPFSIKEQKNLYKFERDVFVQTDLIISEFKKFLDKYFDVITFSGAGEPTLAKNIKEVQKEIKNIIPDKPIILLTNSSLLYLDEAREDISNFDIIDAKIDAVSEEFLKKINRPFEFVKIENILYGIKKLKEEFKGKLHIQIMITDINYNHIEKISKFVNEIKPDEIHLNTPTREPWKKPLPPQKLLPLKKYFKDLKVRTPYD
ncbi:MAG TPA: radical SAM protein [Caldisericia bacterium]|nr:radical SAM protein [Caldisericia bacterium]